jgi:penicillin amidase
MILAAALPAATTPSIETVAGAAGLRERIEIVRDRESVPHIRAGNEADAIFGLGFVHAHDHL